MKHLLPFVIVLFLSACKPYVYRPVTVKPTNFTKKGDAEFSINGFWMGEYHAAYAITNNIAVSATMARVSSHDTFRTRDSASQVATTRINNNKRRDNEFAIGFFTPLGTDGSSFEVFGGAAFAFRKVNTVFSDFKNPANNFTTDLTDNRYRRLFIQPSFGRNGRFIDVAISNRFTFITYDRTNSIPQTTDFISETVMTARYGYKNVKLMTQVGFTIFDPESPYGYVFPFIGFGIYVLFNEGIKSDGI